MKIICKSDTQVFGHGIVCKGETIDWPDGQTFPPQVLGNFKDAEGHALCNKEPQSLPPTHDRTNAEADKQDCVDRPPTPEEAAAEQARAEQLAKDELVKRTAALGKEKLTAALDACGAVYKAKDSCETLAKTLLRAQGQEID